MKDFLKVVLLFSIIPAVASATTNNENLHFTGKVSESVSDCQISVDGDIDLGNIQFSALSHASLGQAVNPVAFRVNVENCTNQDNLALTLNGTPDAFDDALLANNAGSVLDGAAAYVGVVIKDGDNTFQPNGSILIKPDSKGSASHTFYAGMARNSYYTPSIGAVDASATLTLISI